MRDFLLNHYLNYANEEVINCVSAISDFDDLLKYVTSIADNKQELGKREYRRLIKQMMYAIVHTESNPRTIMQYDNMYSFLQSMPTHILTDVCQKCNVNIPPKVRKRGKNSIVERVMKKYHQNERTHNTLTSIIKHHLDIMFPFLNKSNLTVEELLHHVQAFGEQRNGDLNIAKVLFCYMISSMDDDKWIVRLMRTFKADEWVLFEARFLNAYLMYKYYAMMPQQTANNVDLNEIIKEHERLKNMLQKQAKRQEYLKSELYQKNMREKELKGQIHELNRQLQEQLEEAIKEIQRLESEIEEQKNFYEEEIRKLNEQYQEEIYQLKNKIRVLEATHGQADDSYMPLKDMNVCVIGHPKRKNEYKQVVERYGGNFEFYPSSPDSSSLSGMEGPVGRADLIFYLTTYTSHALTNKLKSLAPASKICYLYAGGINYFEHQLLEAVSSNAVDDKVVVT